VGKGALLSLSKGRAVPWERGRPARSFFLDKKARAGRSRSGATNPASPVTILVCLKYFKSGGGRSFFI